MELLRQVSKTDLTVVIAVYKFYDHPRPVFRIFVFLLIPEVPYSIIFQQKFCQPAEVFLLFQLFLPSLPCIHRQDSFQKTAQQTVVIFRRAGRIQLKPDRRLCGNITDICGIDIEYCRKAVLLQNIPVLFPFIDQFYSFLNKQAYLSPADNLCGPLHTEKKFYIRMRKVPGRRLHQNLDLHRFVVKLQVSVPPSVCHTRQKGYRICDILPDCLLLRPISFPEWDYTMIIFSLV